MMVIHPPKFLRILNQLRKNIRDSYVKNNKKRKEKPGGHAQPKFFTFLNTVLRTHLVAELENSKNLSENLGGQAFP